VVDLVLLRRKKKLLEVWEIRSHWVNEIGLGYRERFAKGGLQTMMRKRVNSFLLRLRYLKLLAEINILIGLNGVRRELDFRKAKP
jgi:hypothetical protein